MISTLYSLDSRHSASCQADNSQAVNAHGLNGYAHMDRSIRSIMMLISMLRSMNGHSVSCER